MQHGNALLIFLDQVIPVANEYKVRAACHPHDPGMPPEGYQGVVRVLGTPDGLYKFMGIQESPYHGFNLCLGTTAEMLEDPATEIHDVVRRIGGEKKLFNIHFRNIRGKRDDFQEVYPDEGDMNMVEVARTLWEVDYPYMLMPDHMPQHEDDPRGRQAFAYGFGYIKGILQTLRGLGVRLRPSHAYFCVLVERVLGRGLAIFARVVYRYGHGEASIASQSVLRKVTLFLAQPDEQRCWNTQMEQGHYLGFKGFVGRGLCYIAE